MGRPRRTIHIDRKTESFRQKDDALCLVRAVKARLNTKRYQQQLTDLNHFFPENRTEIPKKTRRNHFSS